MNKAKVLFETIGDRYRYVGVVAGDGHCLIVEKDSRMGKSRSFRVSGQSLADISSQDKAGQYAAAATLFHKARMARRTRRERGAGGSCGKID